MRFRHWTFLLFLTACGPSTPQTDATTDSIPLHTEEAPVQDQLTPPPIDSIPSNIQVDSVIHLSFADGQQKIQVRGAISRDAPRVFCSWKQDRGMMLRASVEPLAPGLKLRFSEIIFPDSSADGPFGKTFNRKLTSAGRYQLIIAPHQMASSSRAGDYTLEFELLAAEDVK